MTNRTRWSASALILFLSLISAPSAGSFQAPQLPEWAWNNVDRIVAVGDLHGDYDQFIKVLQDAGVINKRMNWIGGKTHLVQLGDVADRGPNPRKIMDLLMKLEGQAAKAGGSVHALIGNHEAMNIYGDLRYTTAQEYAEFSNSRSERVRQAFYKQTVEELRKEAEAKNETPVIDDAFRKKWEEQHPLGFFEQRIAFGPNGKYGKWILSHNVVIKINDTLFVHGGIGPKYAAMSPAAINETIRKELGEFSMSSAIVTRDSQGPLWNRELAEGDEALLTPHVDLLLKNLGVNRIVLGHTTTRTTVIPRFGCKVILDDVGLSRVYGGPPACLVIRKDGAYALHRGKMLTIPCDSGKGLLEYLRSAAALDPPPSPIEKTIQELQKKLDAVSPVVPPEFFRAARTDLPAPCPRRLPPLLENSLPPFDGVDVGLRDRPFRCFEPGR